MAMNAWRWATVAVGAACASGPAFGLAQGSFWIEVPIVDSPLDPTDLSGLRCFDLYVQMQPGDAINAVDFGIAGPNDGLSTTQDVFQHAMGNASSLPPDPALLAASPDLQYDTYVGIGNLPATGLGIALALSWNPAGFVGAWFDVPPQSGAGTASDAWFVARITVTSAGGFGEGTSLLGEYLGGQLFHSRPGSGGTVPSTGVVRVRNAFPVPAPGAAAVVGLAGLYAVRRRR